jgi:predicted porin
MKKTAIALAMASLAGSAYAQNVTLYGNFDMSVQQTKSTTAAGTSSTATTQLGGTGTQLSTPVLGVRGSEDLGGGLKAGFQAEGNINPSTGGMGSLATNSNSTASVPNVLFNRQLNVSLEGGFGKVTVGRTGDLVDSLEGYANFNQIFDTEAASANGIGGKNANTVRYDTPKFQGFSAGASYSSNPIGTTSTGAAIDDGNTVSTVAVQYSDGPLTVGGAFGRANVTGTLVEGKIDTYFAGYNFGMADVRIQRTAQLDGTNSRQIQTNEISASIPLGSGLTAVIHAEKASDSTTANAYTQYGASIQKALSKRTQVYGGLRDRNMSATTDTTVFTAGIVHSF